MEIDQMEKIIDLMISKGVAGFEIGDFKVSFWSQPVGVPQTHAERTKLYSEDEIDADLGIMDEEY